DLALIVELGGDFRPHDRHAGADERAWEPAEQVRIFRRLAAVLVFGGTLRIVDADADDLLGRDERREELHILDLVIGLAGHGGARLADRPRPGHIEQRRGLRGLSAQDHDAALDDPARALPTALPSTR